MKYSAKVEISLKPVLFDPEGESTKKSLAGLQFPVENVRSSKVFEIVLNANSRQHAEEIVEGMCRKLLANTNKDNYRFTIEEKNE